MRACVGGHSWQYRSVLKIRAILIVALLAFSFSSAEAKEKRPLAVVFAGPTIDYDSLKNLEELAESRGYRTSRAFPGDTTPALLAKTAVYMVPGGSDLSDLKEGWSGKEREAIRSYVRNGGRYLGFCLGGYWASHARYWEDPIPSFRALDLLPVPVHAYSETTEPRTERIRWHDGKYRYGFFQDGPDFGLPTGSPDEQVFGLYENGTVATAIYRVGKGKVGVSGPHWEAADDWYDEEMPDQDPAHRELAAEFFDELLR